MRTTRLRGWLAGLSTSALVLTAVTATAPAALADTAPPTNLPATVSADALPTWQVDGIVWSQVTVGTTVYATGSFTTARPPGVPVGGSGQISVGHLIAYDITTGNLVSSFRPVLNGQGRSITASPDGSRIYVGGDFTTVTVNGTTSTRKNLAAFSTDGTLASDFAALDLDGAVMSMTAAQTTASTTTLYLGGAFTRIGTTSRKYIAAVDGKTGAIRTGWAPSADDGYVKALTMTPDKSKVIAGGQFSTLSTVAAKGMGALDATTGAVLPWAANKVIIDSGSSAIDTLSSDGTSVYGGGYAYRSGGFFEGTFALNPADGSVRWADDCQGDTYDVEPVGNVVYSVGHSHDCSMLGLWPDTVPRTRYQPATAMTTTSSGIKNKGPSQYGWDYRSLDTSTMLQWFPALGLGTVSGQSQAAWSVTSGAGYVALGGEFPTVDGRPQQGLTRYAVRSTKATDKVGPRYDGTAPVRTAAPQTLATKPSTSTPRSVPVTWGSAWDQDNTRLTYKVYRDKATAAEALVTTATADTAFWKLPTQSFTDTNVPVGIHTYQVLISDPFGNTLLSPVSNPVGVQTNLPPTASFVTSSNALDATFNGTSSSDDASVAAWSWDFGDGTARGSGSTATHRYAATGNYKVTLTVTDSQGATASTTSTATITNAAGPYYKIDEFGRFVSTGWGTANNGGTWNTGTSTAFAVTEGVGTIAVAVGSGPTANLTASTTDTDLSFTFASDRTAAGGGSAFISAYARGDGASGYSAKLYAPGTSSMTLSLVGREVGKSEVTLRSVTLPNGLVAGQRYNLRVQAVGSGTTALRARVWADGSAEPTTWQVETTDTTSSLQAAAGIAVQGYLSTRTTNGPLTFSIDHLVARASG